MEARNTVEGQEVSSDRSQKLEIGDDNNTIRTICGFWSIVRDVKNVMGEMTESIFDLR
jgi:hypothetical protein